MKCVGEVLSLGVVVASTPVDTVGFEAGFIFSQQVTLPAAALTKDIWHVYPRRAVGADHNHNRPLILYCVSLDYQAQDRLAGRPPVGLTRFARAGAFVSLIDDDDQRTMNRSLGLPATACPAYMANRPEGDTPPR